MNKQQHLLPLLKTLTAQQDGLANHSVTCPGGLSPSSAPATSHWWGGICKIQYRIQDTKGRKHSTRRQYTYIHSVSSELQKESKVAAKGPGLSRNCSLKKEGNWVSVYVCVDTNKVQQLGGHGNRTWECTPWEHQKQDTYSQTSITRQKPTFQPNAS